jgi:hypothetical protein
MNSRFLRFAGVLCLAAAIGRPGFTQTAVQPPNPTAQLQKLTNSAMKIGIGTAAVSTGVAVIGFVVHHRHQAAKKSRANKNALAQPFLSSPGAVCPAQVSR